MDDHEATNNKGEVARGRGATYNQIKAAPIGALYICRDAHAANHIKRYHIVGTGRADLKVISLDSLKNMSGCRFTGVIFDHQCRPSYEQISMAQCLLDHIIRREE